MTVHAVVTTAIKQLSILLTEHPIVQGCFILRENRFIARVMLEDSKIVRAHVPNTGRMKELLVKNACVKMAYSPSPTRKTEYSLLAVYYQGTWVSVHAMKANQLAENWIIRQPGVTHVKREVTYGKSRFDLGFKYGEKNALFEVKSVNLVRNGIALFPDAPTTRGNKHLLELIKAQQENYYTGILFVIMRGDAHRFTPNIETDPEFSANLKMCQSVGMMIKALRYSIENNRFVFNAEIPIDL